LDRTGTTSKRFATDPRPELAVHRVPSKAPRVDIRAADSS
jgi:hypothetical protein